MAVDMTKECMDLLRRIQEMEFVALELNLYLDTHPNDTRALEDYNRAAKELKELRERYDELCGPILSYGHSRNRGNTWLWAETPWPWEM
ncbi:MAG: spore coat peptide assembly protein cotJB [Peptococcaceae bacterium]|jgi:spore coat protein JB|nr:spore coat peptide assembly protein cotJB [Peptococcaceae bacterium]